jgi:hypothetical protein
MSKLETPLHLINGTFKKVHENNTIQPDFLKFKIKDNHLKITQIYKDKVIKDKVIKGKVIKGKGNITNLKFNSPEKSCVNCNSLIGEDMFVNQCSGEGIKFSLPKMKYKVIHQFINDTYCNNYYFEDGTVSIAHYRRVE